MEMANGDYVVDDRSSSGIRRALTRRSRRGAGLLSTQSAVARGFQHLWDGTITTIFIFNIVHY